MSLAHYLLQVNIYLIIFYCFYQLLLAKETYFVLNRVYLMAAGLLSLTIPFLRFEWFSKQEVTQKIYVSVDQLNALVAQVNIVDDAAEFNWGNLIVIIYLAGIVFCIVKFIYQLLAIQKMFANIANGSAFSFFKKKAITANLPHIATVHLHEDIHIKQLHSIDVIFFEIIGILTWFNPIIYAYKKTIKNIHEYLADEAAANFQGDKEAYAMLLLSQAFGVKPHTLTNHFYNKSLIKKRILMLHKQRSKKTAILKYGLFVPLFALTLVLSSATIRKNDQILAVAEKIPLNNANKLVSQVIAEPLTIVNLTRSVPPATSSEKTTTNTLSITAPTSTQTENAAAWNSFYKFLSNEIKYPEAAKQKGIQGNSIINFSVKRGRITDVAIESELGEGCDDEVINNISAFDDYFGKDGNYSLKVSFKLQGSNAPFKNEEATTPDDFTALPSMQVTALDEPTASDKVFSFVSLSSPPTYPGGMLNFYNFLSKNIKYPILAAENDIEGNVFVSFTVEKDGSLTDIKVDRKLGYGTDEEAVRVLKLTKKWNPGLVDGRAVRVKYNIPIRFALNAESKEPKTNVIANVKLKGIGNTENPPLVVIDNEVSDPSVLNTINANSIKSVEVLKAANAVAAYGKNAAYGAVIITSKKAKNPTATILNKN